MADRYDAVVVGAGPNGLAAAITVAEADRSVLVLEGEEEIGGGTRTAELTLPGFLHDVCSAIHPTGVLSPFFRQLPLADHGLEWIQPELPVAHPLDDGSAGALMRSLEDTAEALGEDRRAYLRLIGPVVRHWARLEDTLLGPPLGAPRYPILAARFGFRALWPAERLGRLLRHEPARALFAGLAAHGIMPLDRWLTGSFGLVFAATGHVAGWPLARGGSRSITTSLGRHLENLGGRIETGWPIRSFADLPTARAYLFDLTPRQLEEIAGDRLPARYRRRLGRFRYGPAAFKVDYALDGPVPWKAEECTRAGTVHVGGTFEEVAEAEAAVGRGGHPERPFVLVAQQSLFDPSRAPEGHQTLWAYCHVPNGSTVDMTERIEAQIERFAPGFRDLILARHVMPPAGLQDHNPNYVGGDIAGGAHGGLQLLARPVLSLDPYATPAEGIYLCSSSTPPGAGVHGMCGHHAARSALRRSLA